MSSHDSRPGRRSRVLVDGTPLLGQRSGVGRYTAALLAELATRPDVEVLVTAFTARGQGALRALVPDGVRVRGGPVPARALRAAWRRGNWPPVELLAGRAEVLHATNFVLPPSRHARGVVTIHDLAFLDRPDHLAAAQRDLPALVRSAVARAAVVCTPSAAVAGQVARRLRVPAERIVVTPLGVDQEWLAASPPTPALQARLRLPRRYLLFVGAAQPRKGLDVLLTAHAAQPDLPPLVLAGPAGWGEPLATCSRVHPVGYLDDADLHAVVAGAAALVLPSRDEGFGLPVLEAMATGVPVVCSDLPALREIASGLATLVPPGDPTPLAAALGTVAGAGPDPAAATARRAHAASYTWRACATATVHAYRRARE
ncbi:MAG TPA: glycosyltransferase family 1 protein [Pseudonocardiaceae bacterium]|jgi:glycosyltransferase involved in cell wall biosynthesis|nr:glycosyltransferase family 1 protein [Pseudonocardiaceae bacterium]